MFKGRSDDWIIPGTYEFTNPIVHNLSSRIEMNDEESTLIGIPDQNEIHLILKGFAERIRDDKWFTDPEKSKSEFSKLERGIAKAMHKFRLNDNSMIGLLGELKVLYKMLENCKAESFNRVLDSWQGHSSKVETSFFQNHAWKLKQPEPKNPPPTLNSASVICPRVAYFVVSINSSNTFP